MFNLVGTIRAARWSARRGPCLEIPSSEADKLCIGCEILKSIMTGVQRLRPGLFESTATYVSQRPHVIFGVTVFSYRLCICRSRPWTDLTLAVVVDGIEKTV